MKLIEKLETALDNDDFTAAENVLLGMTEEETRKLEAMLDYKYTFYGDVVLDDLGHYVYTNDGRIVPSWVLNAAISGWYSDSASDIWALSMVTTRRLPLYGLYYLLTNWQEAANRNETIDATDYPNEADIEDLDEDIKYTYAQTYGELMNQIYKCFDFAKIKPDTVGYLIEHLSIRCWNSNVTIDM